MCHKLKWNKQIKYVINKLRRIMYAFKSLDGIFDYKKPRIEYHAMVESVIYYGISVWGGTHNSTIHPLKKNTK